MKQLAIRIGLALVSLGGSYLAVMLIQDYWLLSATQYWLIFLVIFLAIILTMFQFYWTWKQQKEQEQQHDDKND